MILDYMIVVYIVVYDFRSYYRTYGPIASFYDQPS